MLKNIIGRNDLLPKVLVSVRAPADVLGVEQVRDNLAVVDWHMPVSFKPAKYAVGVRTDSSIKKMISKASNFVVNFMGHEHRNVVLLHEHQDGLFTDLFFSMGFAKSDADMVESPRVKEAEAVLECEVEHELETGDHTIFIGRIVGPRA
jgi:flavin reductase (DIM6/NTAB) family NADH-FMN oxidoreductase RutF